MDQILFPVCVFYYNVADVINIITEGPYLKSISTYMLTRIQSSFYINHIYK